MTKRIRKDDPPDLAIISLRLTGAEGMRFKNLEATVHARNKFVPRSSIIRELIGLDAPDVLTEAEIAHFRNNRQGEVKTMRVVLEPPPERVSNAKSKTG